jgi:serine/threonine protein kinase
MPTTLDDRYQLGQLVGFGAAGRVYRARDLRLARDVAVKRLRADALGGDEMRARFEREALALARVSDPHVLPVFDVSADADDPYLVTAFCPDGTLADRIGSGPLTCQAVRELVHDVGAGLVAMHRAGIVHRDIKPSNILRLDGRWVIGDLGIARVEGDPSLTQTGAVIGTPDYWAPETARGQAPTPAVDVYGLGCVVFEALSGQPPFRGASPLETGLLHATATTPDLPGSVRKEDPLRAGLVLRMLDKSPGARPVPAELGRALAADLASASADTLAYPDDATVPMTAPSLPPTLAYPIPPERRRRRVSRRRALLTGSAVALAAALVLAALALHDNRAASAPTPQLTTATTPAKGQIANTVARSRRSVPSLVGQSVASATAQLSKSGLQLAVAGTVASSVPRGSITGQSPEAADRVASGTTVHVTVSAGPPEAAPVSTATPAPDVGKPHKPKPAKERGHGKGEHVHGNK